MKCPMCNAEIPDNSGLCSFCGCKINYNGRISSHDATTDLPENNKTKSKKLIVILVVIIAVLLFALIISLSKSKNSTSDYNDNINTSTYSYYGSDTTYSSNGSYSTTESYSGNEEVKDWMKDQAEGKDYSSDDGGDYYCMGKNDTCPNKTHNAYDLYCDSCDPNGDNIEG